MHYDSSRFRYSIGGRICIWDKHLDLNFSSFWREVAPHLLDLFSLVIRRTYSFARSSLSQHLARAFSAFVRLIYLSSASFYLDPPCNMCMGVCKEQERVICV